ncbi:putative aldehyde dehydrogenase, partial [Mucuna pruriens]
MPILIDVFFCLTYHPFVESLSSCPKHGVHNPFKAPERYLMYGEICTKAAHMLSLPKVSDFFTKGFSKELPEGFWRSLRDTKIFREFLFVSWQGLLPYLEIILDNKIMVFIGHMVLDSCPSIDGCTLYMGNKPVLKVDSKVSIVMEQMFRLLHSCGLPVEDIDFINSDGKTMNKLLLEVTTDSMLEHVKKLLEILGSKLLFGGQPLEDHSIPSIYGAIKPTAVYVPLEEIRKDKNFELVTKEIFGPFQEVIGKSVNGTTYAGLRARTTGAPQNHWFGPAGDARGAGIGTPEAIKLVWSCHREIIYDFGPVPKNWEIPPST